VNVIGGTDGAMDSLHAGCIYNFNKGSGDNILEVAVSINTIEAIMSDTNLYNLEFCTRHYIDGVKIQNNSNGGDEPMLAFNLVAG
jgi:hypothetical protein